MPTQDGPCLADLSASEKQGQGDAEPVTTPLEVPQGKWRLPPQQRVLQKGETTFDLDGVAQNLTIVITTSVSEWTPSTETPLAVLESLQDNLALRWCRKLLVFDCVPSPEDIEELRRDAELYRNVARGAKWIKTWNEKRISYEEYFSKLQAMKESNHPALLGVELIRLPRFGHLFGTVKVAFNDHINTPFAFITQHDLKLSGKFVASDVQNILEQLAHGTANYVVLNRDVNNAARTNVYFRIVPSKSVKDDTRLPSGLRLTAVQGFSDQAHFANVEWYRREVVEAIPFDKELTCMEHVLHDPWKDAEAWKGTFLYGGLDEGPYTLDFIYGYQVYDREGKLMRVPAPPRRRAE